MVTGHPEMGRPVTRLAPILRHRGTRACSARRAQNEPTARNEPKRSHLETAAARQKRGFRRFEHARRLRNEPNAPDATPPPRADRAAGRYTLRPMRYDLGIIGAGNMAEAIARGVIARNVLTPDRIIAADVSPQRRQLFQDQLKITAVEDNAAAARDARVILLSVKPQQMAAALAALAPAITEQTLVVSIAAGISTAFIEKHLGGQKRWRVVRTMPNTPMLVGEGMVAMSAGANATRDDLAAARRLFEAAADVIELDEDKIDTVTAVSGSGPAYFFFLVEQMIRAGTELGLTPDQARQLAIKTAVGAGRMLATATDEPAELRRKVTSPGGTTEAAITSMTKNNWPQITVDAIKAAEKRGKELGQ
jgi:pyrroline-5-carboxylate reductase